MRIAHVPFGSQKIASGAAGRAGSGLRFFADQQRGEVDRRNFHVTYDDARHDDGAIQNGHLCAVRQGDDQVTAVNGYVVDVGSRGEDKDAVCANRDSAHRAWLDMVPLHPSSECIQCGVMRLLTVSGGIDIPFALEIHLSIPSVTVGRTEEVRRRSFPNATRALRSSSSSTYGISGSAIAYCLQSPVGEAEQAFDRPGLTPSSYYF
ncbi:hypothetical protein SPHS6_00149 [Sphingobium sp. S6]|nr:hypothetical protein SPHS8_00149 [Sphingobium sp. S8]CAD7334746.1 hypothetical protein SPHS6_00149 [Sphingobium sp. S6]